MEGHDVSGRDGWRWVRVAIGAPVLLFALGSIADLLGGLPFWSGAHSPVGWGVGVLALGTLYVLAEAGSYWLDKRDEIASPLWKRVLHLVALLGFASVCGLLVWALWIVVT